MKQGGFNYAPMTIGEDLFQNGTWNSDIRPDGNTLVILLDALSLQVSIAPVSRVTMMILGFIPSHEAGNLHNGFHAYLPIPCLSSFKQAVMYLN